jgi:ATP adenylyltransferase
VERLWAPWRHAYVTSANAESSGCIFCNTSEPGRDELVVFRGSTCYVILNLYPYNSGHLMVVPRRHIPSLQVTTAEERDELMTLTRRAEMALTEAYRPQGINIGINLGRPAGAGVLDHLHVHAVPRWNGDTNFMTVVGDTRVLPEDLQATRTRLQPIFERLAHETTKPRPDDNR